MMTPTRLICCGVCGFLVTTMMLANISIAADSTPNANDKWHAYFGTYTGPKSRGVYHSMFDPATGKLGPAELVAETTNPSFLNIHPNGKFLYCVGHEGQTEGGVLAFAIDGKTGKLTQLGKQAASGGGPCYVAVDRSGKCVLAVNYHLGNVASMAIRADGSLADATNVIHHEGTSSDPARQKGAHPHSINVDPTNRLAIVADLGIDKLMLYDLDAEQAKLTPHNPPFVSVTPGGGPRHFVFHPNGKFAFANNELTASVMAFAFDAERGTLKELQMLSTLPADFTGKKSTAEIQIHPNGRFLYVSNRGHDSIAIFAVDPNTGRLTSLGHEPTGGEIPRNFCIDPTGMWLLVTNQGSDNVTVFKLDPQTGRLTPTGNTIEVGAPVCVKFAPISP
jgi:6-phosphogluconolactonase